ncbi:hypothetical protein [Streptomyces sp. NPDC007205]|uniref:hypothetical protein n=1 Tax=Streptomyces sp. NPDC007205 TaxID=3154316 RepID=UPI0033E8A726
MHIALGNVPPAGALSVIEGSGNLNIVKTSGAGRFTHGPLAALAELDPTGWIAQHGPRFPSSRTARLERLCAPRTG